MKQQGLKACLCVMTIFCQANALQAGEAMPSMDPGKPVAGSRDPHAYADGYTRASAPYALPDSQRLHMADEHLFWAVQVDQLETVHGDDNAFQAYDLQVWLGSTYDRAVVKAEGDMDSGSLESSQTEFLWRHAVTGFWDVQSGIRHDSGDAPDRTWLALGVQGLAPYWLDVSVMAYLGDHGRSALQVKSEYELLLTQRWVLQPSLELNAYGKSDPAAGTGRGLSDVTLGMRLRYEFTRQFAPYVGVEWERAFSVTEDYAHGNGQDAHDTRWVAGLRFWF